MENNAKLTSFVTFVSCPLLLVSICTIRPRATVTDALRSRHDFLALRVRAKSASLAYFVLKVKMWLTDRRVEVPVSNSVLLATVLALFSAGCLARTDQVTIKNGLADCSTITLNNVTTDANIVLANTTIKLAKPIGECRCLSALATYSSSVERGGGRQVLQEGLVSLKSGGDKVLVLATEPALVAKKNITVELGCAGPL